MSKKILYTVCSANHLAHCKTMVDSFAQYNPAYTILVFLIDKIEGRFDGNFLAPHQLIEIESLAVNGFAAMAAQYSVIELNCAMKPFVAQYIFEKEQPDTLIYIDSDTLIFNSFATVEAALEQYNILITPHFTQPYPDTDKLPHERDILRSGIYNAGFLAMKNSADTHSFLQWWATHAKHECYYNFAEGMGVDQIWLNLVPLLFNNVGIFKHPGANIAYWNLHERQLTKQNETLVVNEQFPVLFLHISGYQFNQPEVLSRHQNRYTANQLPLLKELLQQYSNAVMQNGYELFSEMVCSYAVKKKKSMGIMKTVNKLLKPLGVKISDV